MRHGVGHQAVGRQLVMVRVLRNFGCVERGIAAFDPGRSNPIAEPILAADGSLQNPNQYRSRFQLSVANAGRGPGLMPEARTPSVRMLARDNSNPLMLSISFNELSDSPA